MGVVALAVPFTHAQRYDAANVYMRKCHVWSAKVKKMERGVFHKLFKTGAAPAVFPVIHVQNFEQAKRNVTVALRQGAQGVFLINHDFFAAELLPIIKKIRASFPYLWLGVNFLGVTGKFNTKNAVAREPAGERASDGIGYW